MTDDTERSLSETIDIILLTIMRINHVGVAVEPMPTLNIKRDELEGMDFVIRVCLPVHSEGERACCSVFQCGICIKEMMEAETTVLLATLDEIAEVIKEHHDKLSTITVPADSEEIVTHIESIGQMQIDMAEAVSTSRRMPTKRKH